jgi:hypothetical protein
VGRRAERAFAASTLLSVVAIGTFLLMVPEPAQSA